jgi:hypothetical protein
MFEFPVLILMFVVVADETQTVLSNKTMDGALTREANTGETAP